MSTITVYTKPACVQCTATYRALETIKDLGYLQAPVVVVDAGRHWSGFRPDEISKL